jgi:hypothetical protein
MVSIGLHSQTTTPTVYMPLVFMEYLANIIQLDLEHTTQAKSSCQQHHPHTCIKRPVFFKDVSFDVQVDIFCFVVLSNDFLL